MVQKDLCGDKDKIVLSMKYFSMIVKYFIRKAHSVSKHKKFLNTFCHSHYKLLYVHCGYILKFVLSWSNLKNFECARLTSKTIWQVYWSSLFFVKPKEIAMSRVWQENEPIWLLQYTMKMLKESHQSIPVGLRLGTFDRFWNLVIQYVSKPWMHG